ncbi:hypothetical protein Bbelb_260020 [Branchiostoma belcheri]|nr:hypothetical protein Bbelb_260020 [Branchiostoma belcheri]
MAYARDRTSVSVYTERDGQRRDSRSAPHYQEGLDVAGSGTMRSNGQQFLQSLQSFKLKAGSIGQCGNVTVRAIAHFCHGQLRQEVLANAVRTISCVYTRRGGILTPRWAIVHDRTPAFEVAYANCVR